jgi:CheY-like chemotaxis protein
MMPEMDGIEVCRRRNSNSATHYMPAVLVTALDLACRCGGEEFVIVIPETDMVVATMVAAAAPVHCGRAVPSREELEAAGGDAVDSYRCGGRDKRDGRNRMVADAA